MPEPQQRENEIIGCIVGAFLHPSRLNPETAEMLVPNPQVHSKLFYIMTLGTVEEYRNLGLATLLVQQAMDLIEEDPTCGALYLHVIPFNHAAIRFYEKLGFYRVCTIANYYNIDDKHYDCFLYAKYFHGECSVANSWQFASTSVSLLLSLGDNRKSRSPNTVQSIYRGTVVYLATSAVSSHFSQLAGR